ncbi:E3 ubiquitin-protein ligase TTC3, partial [Ophiophagus hannah]
MWCSKPVFQLQKYCDIIKICTFRPLLFVPHCDPSKKCHDPSCQFDELNMEKLCQIEILEDVTELDDQLFISGILTTETDLEKGILRTSEVLEWMKYADHIGILQKLRKLADYCCWSILKLFFSAYKYYISKVILEDYNLVEAFESYYCDNCMMGHYRFCDALSFLGEHRKALEANERGQDQCRENPEGMKGLIEQHEKLKNQMEEAREYVSFGNQESKKETKNLNENKKLCDSHHHPCQQKQTNVVGNTKTRENIDHLSVFTAEVSENPQKQRSQMDDSEKMKEQLNLKTDSKKVVEKYNFQCGNVQQGDVILSLEMLKTYMKNGSTSLMNQCFHSAEQSFALPLNTLDLSQLQCLNLALVDYVVIIYGYASALLGIGQPEELNKAKYHFDKIIEQYQKVRFNCLAHYGIGKVYLRQNRFSDALDQFMKSKTMVNLKIVPGVLTWPTTSVIIKETRSETLQVILEDCITECKFHPKPDALCRYQQCQGHKIQIYFNDPDFKGFIRIVCCQRCLVEFHLSCWKKVKAARYCDKNDKLQIKQEKKLRRKFIKEAVSFRNLEVFHRSNIVAKDDSFKGNTPNNFFVEDTVLQLIGRYTMTIQDGIHDVSKLLIELLSWWVLNEEDYALFSTSCLSSAEIMDQLISLLIAKNDRVKTRVFVHVVSEFEEVDPKLHDWMKHLDNNGLKATEFFLSEYITYILQIDFNSVAVLWNEKYGIKLSRTFTCLSEDIDEIIKYLEELSLTELRCLVWLLEENRQSFPFLHQCLDDYFDNLGNYFSQILEEHGPMEIDNPLLVGEYEDFPADTRRIVENAGGLKSFLLGSLHFVMVDDLIGLMKHAVMLQENAELIEIDENNYSESLYCQKNNFHSISSLNPTAEEFKPVSFINKPYISTSPNNLEYVTASHSSFSPFASSYSFSSQTTDTEPVASIPLSPTVPDDYTIILNKIHSEYVNERLSPVFTQVPFMPDISEETNYIYADYNTHLDSDSEEATYSKCNVDKFTAADQVDQELTDAGVNTLPLHPYESQQGDMLRMEKEHHVLQKQLKEAIEKYEQLKCRSSKETSILEEELSLLIEGNKV